MSDEHLTQRQRDAKKRAELTANAARAEAARAQTFIDEFVATATEQGPAPHPLKATTMDGVVTSSQSATGALQAAQAGNQLLALQSQQLADLTALLAAQGRAQALDSARNAAVEAESRERPRRFLTRPTGYQPGNARMFHD